MIVASKNGTAPKLPPRTDGLTDAALSQRPDYDGITYWGSDHSLKQLPHFAFTWRNLEAAFEATGKPIGDLGACYSTLGLEGALRGIEITPIDIRLLSRDMQYISGVLGAFEHVLPYYFSPERFPAGYEPRGFIASQKLESHALLARAEEVLRSALPSDLADIQAHDRAFSITIAHDSVPKHSATKEEFLHRQLPEILRVTEREARIYPLAMSKTLGKNLSEVYRFAREEAALHEAAARAGFSFQLSTPFEFIDPLSSPHNLGVPLLGIFTRRA